MEKKLVDVFTQCQSGTHAHDRLIKIATSLHEKSDVDAFCEKFINLTRYPMVVLKREPTVERTIKFISKFIASLMVVGEDGQPKECPLFDQFFDFLLEAHEANSKAVRLRTCQLIAEIIQSLGDVEMDEDLCDRIYKGMLTRLSDKVPAVRVYAVQALCRLQDPTDKKCPIMKAFLFLMSKDPNQEVRMTCLKYLAPVRRTLSAILERARDVNDSVRKTAYLILSEKVNMKALSIAQRITLLEDGLSDRSPVVQSVCADKLLQAWLVHCSANVLDLLSGLDVMSSGDVCEKAVKKILAKVPITDLLDGCDIINEDRLMNDDNLNCESVFYWRLLCKHIQAQGTDVEEMMEKILPDTKDFISFIEKVANKSPHGDGIEEKATNEFIILQLVTMIQYLDVSDPVSRKSVLNLCKSLLQSDHVSISLCSVLIKSISRVLDNPTQRIQEISDIISEIMMPSGSGFEEEAVAPEILRQLKVKLANLNMEINELNEKLETAVNEQDYTAAAELKDAIKCKEVSRKEVSEHMLPTQVPLPSQPRTDDSAKQKCLSIYTEMMKSKEITKITDAIRTFMDVMILPAIPDISPSVRNQAVKALGHCCLLDLECARKNVVIFVQIAQLDEEAIRVSALEVIFDIIQTFGIECFETREDGKESAHHGTKQGNEDQSGNSSTVTSDTEQNDGNDSFCAGYEADKEADTESEESANRNANNLIHIIVGFLDDESSDVRSITAEGLAKLLLSGRIVSAKLLTRLIVLWYNPITEDDTRLRHCLGVFFPVYSFCNRMNQSQVEEAFLPTLKIIFEAPNTSPLSDIDENNVSELLIQLADHRQVLSKQPSDELNSHDSLALKICNEIIQAPNTYGTPTLAKALTLLELTMDNEELCKDLTNLVNEISGAVKDKKSLKFIQKFAAKLKTMKFATTEQSGETESLSTNDTEQLAEGVQEIIDSSVLETTANGLKKRTRSLRNNSTTLDSIDDNSDSSTSSVKATNKKLPRLEEQDSDSD